MKKDICDLYLPGVHFKSRRPALCALLRGRGWPQRQRSAKAIPQTFWLGRRNPEDSVPGELFLLFCPHYRRGRLCFQKLKCKLSFFNSADLLFGAVKKGQSNGLFQELLQGKVDLLAGSQFIFLESHMQVRYRAADTHVGTGQGGGERGGYR